MAIKQGISSETARIGRGAKIIGRVTGDGDLVVEGRIEGDVSIEGDLHLVEGSVVQAPIAARGITIEGAIIGDVTATGAVVLRASGSVQGAISSDRLVLEEGARFSGRIEMNVELPPQLAASGRRGPG